MLCSNNKNYYLKVVTFVDRRFSACVQFARYYLVVKLLVGYMLNMNLHWHCCALETRSAQSGEQFV